MWIHDERPGADAPLEIVYGAPTQAEAALVAGLLESAGIPATVVDGGFTAFHAAVAIATRGYRVAVEAGRRAEAEEILIENEYVIPELQEDVPPDAAVCPKCLRTVMPDWNACRKCGEPFDWESHRGR